jgi:predicted ATP-dependent serine protease
MKKINVTTKGNITKHEGTAHSGKTKSLFETAIDISGSQEVLFITTESSKELLTARFGNNPNIKIKEYSTFQFDTTELISLIKKYSPEYVFIDDVQLTKVINNCNETQEIVDITNKYSTPIHYSTSTTR